MKTINFYLPFLPLYVFMAIALILLVKSFIKMLFPSLTFSRFINGALKVYFVLTVIYIIIVSVF